MSTISSGTTLTTALVQTGDTTGDLVIKTNNGNTTAATFTTGGNLNIPTAGARITGDFSNATLANRVAFQTSTTNSATSITVLPNGTSTQTQLALFNSSDPNNGTLFDTLINASEGRFRVLGVGTGSNLPMTFHTGGSERLRIDTSGNVGIAATPSAWASNWRSLQVGRASISGAGTNFTQYSTNAYFDGTSYRYIANGYSQRIVLDGDNGGVSFGYAPSGTAGNAISFSESVRIDTSGNLQFNSGYGSVATAYGCRAWVNFNGTGTVSIRGSGNVSSISDLGTGSYQINFATAMVDTTYCAVFGSDRTASASDNSLKQNESYAPTTSNLRVYQVGTSFADCAYGYVAIFR